VEGDEYDYHAYVNGQLQIVNKLTTSDCPTSIRYKIFKMNENAPSNASTQQYLDTCGIEEAYAEQVDCSQVPLPTPAQPPAQTSAQTPAQPPAQKELSCVMGDHFEYKTLIDTDNGPTWKSVGPLTVEDCNGRKYKHDPDYKRTKNIHLTSRAANVPISAYIKKCNLQEFVDEEVYCPTQLDYKYITKPWSQCKAQKADCGPDAGIQKREVECHYRNSKVAMNECDLQMDLRTQKPDDFQVCDMPACEKQITPETGTEYKWLTSEWERCKDKDGRTDCKAPGSTATRKRVVHGCEQTTKYPQPRTQIVSDDQCKDLERPAEEEECDMRECPEYRYEPTPWSECRPQYKLLNVITGGLKDSQDYDQQALICNCMSKTESGSQWQNSARAAAGYQNRAFKCVDYEGNEVDDTKCKDIEISPEHMVTRYNNADFTCPSGDSCEIPLTSQPCIAFDREKQCPRYAFLKREWSDCGETSCEQTRVVDCVDMHTGNVVQDSDCDGPTPSRSKECGNVMPEVQKATDFMNQFPLEWKWHLLKFNSNGSPKGQSTVTNRSIRRPVCNYLKRDNTNYLEGQGRLEGNVLMPSILENKYKKCLALCETLTEAEISACLYNIHVSMRPFKWVNNTPNYQQPQFLKGQIQTTKDSEDASLRLVSVETKTINRSDGGNTRYTVLSIEKITGHDTRTGNITNERWVLHPDFAREDLIHSTADLSVNAFYDLMPDEKECLTPEIKRRIDIVKSQFNHQKGHWVYVRQNQGESGRPAKWPDERGQSEWKYDNVPDQLICRFLRHSSAAVSHIQEDGNIKHRATSGFTMKPKHILRGCELVPNNETFSLVPWLPAGKYRQCIQTKTTPGVYEKTCEKWSECFNWVPLQQTNAKIQGTITDSEGLVKQRNIELNVAPSKHSMTKTTFYLFEDNKQIVWEKRISDENSACNTFKHADLDWFPPLEIQITDNGTSAQIPNGLYKIEAEQWQGSVEKVWTRRSEQPIVHMTTETDALGRPIRQTRTKALSGTLDINTNEYIFAAVHPDEHPSPSGATNQKFNVFIYINTSTHDGTFVAARKLHQVWTLLNGPPNPHLKRPLPPNPIYGSCKKGHDIAGGFIAATRNNTFSENDLDCQKQCQAIPDCTAWVRSTAYAQNPNRCYMTRQIPSTIQWKSANNRNAGYKHCEPPVSTLPADKNQKNPPDITTWHKDSLYKGYQYGGLRMHKFRYGDTQSRLRFVRSPKLDGQLTYYTESQFKKEKSFNTDIQFNLQNAVGDFGKQDFNVNTIKITFAVFSTSELTNSKLLWSAGEDSNGQSISIDKDNVVFTNKRNGKNYTIPHQLQLVPRSWNWYYTFIIHHHHNYGLQLHVKTPENTWTKQTQQMNLSFDDVKGFPYGTFVSQHVANLAWYQAKGNITQTQFNGMVDLVKISDIPQPQSRGIELPVCSGGTNTHYNPQTPDHYAHYFNLIGKGNLQRKDQFPQQGQPSQVCMSYTTRSGYPQCGDSFWMTQNDAGISDGTDRI